MGAPVVPFRLPTALATLGLVLVARSVNADDAAPMHTARLAYDRGDLAACPTEASFRNAVAGRLGYEPFVPTAKMAISVSFARAGKGQKLLAQVAVTDENGRPAGRRDLQSDTEDCTELAASLAIAVSIAIDPQSLTRPAPARAPDPAPPSVGPPPQPSAVREPEPVSPPTPTPTPVPDFASPRFHVAVGATGSLLGQPTFALGPVLEAGLRVKSFSLALAGRSEFGVASRRLGAADVTSYAPQAVLIACWHVGRFALCGDLGAGAFVASTASGAGPVTAASPYVIVAPAVAYEQPLTGPIALRFGFDLRVALVHPRIRFDGKEVWSAVAPIVPAGAIALKVHF